MKSEMTYENIVPMPRLQIIMVGGYCTINCYLRRDRNFFGQHINNGKVRCPLFKISPLHKAIL